MMEKTELTGMTRDELTAWMAAQGYPAFRGKQVFEWIHRGADFDEMTNLSNARSHSRCRFACSGKARWTER